MPWVMRRTVRAGGPLRAARPALVGGWALRAPSAFAALVVSALMWLVPATALAHPLIDEGKRRYDEADFQGALDAFTRAEQATDLTREDLVQLYLRRAMVHHAMRHTEDLEADAFRLACLDRGLTLPRSAPPAVRRAYDEAVARAAVPVRVDVEVQPMPGGLKLTARVTDDNAGLVQSLRIRARTPGGSWQRAGAGSIEVPAPAGSAVEYVAEAVGPGGAVLAFAGTESTPLVANSAVSTGTGTGTGVGTGTGIGTGIGPGTGTGTGPGDEDTGGLGPWPWIIGGGVLVVAAVVVIVILMSGSKGDQPISGPMVTF